MSFHITYRRATKEEYPAILKLYNKMYKTNRSLEDFQWLTEDNPAGKAAIFVAYHGDDVVGIQSLIPYVFIRNGEQILTYKSEDSLVRDDLRGQGIYSTLYRMVHYFTPFTLVWGLTDKKAILENVDMPSSHRLLIAVSVKRPGFVNEYQGLQRFVAKSLFYSWVYLKTSFSSKSVSSNLDITELSQEDYGNEIVSRFFSKLSKDYPKVCFPLMDENYLNWRFSQNPGLDDYRIYYSTDDDGGICICSIIGFKGKSAYWQSFYALKEVSDDIQIAHIQMLRKRIFKSGYQIIHTWLFDNNTHVEKVKQLFLKSGFAGVRKGLWIVNNAHRVDEDVHDLYFSPQLGIR